MEAKSKSSASQALEKLHKLEVKDAIVILDGKILPLSPFLFSPEYSSDALPWNTGW